MKLVKHVGLALIVATIAWSCNDSNTNQPEQNQQEERELSPQQEQVQTPQRQAAPASGELDAYGREPGHEHYGHDHPRQDQGQSTQPQPGSPMLQTSPMKQGSPVQTQQAPASGEPDKYGRKPGAEHYGHDHPLLDEEKN